MTQKRWTQLMHSKRAVITLQERRLGWHFCSDWDGLLVGPGMEEMKTCNHLIYPKKKAKK